MANFIYDIPISFNLEAALFREGETQDKESFNSYIDLSLSAKHQDIEKQLNKQIQGLTQDDVIKASVALEFKFIIAEFIGQEYELLKFRTSTNNVLSLVFSNVVNQEIKLSLSKLETQVSIKGLRLQPLQQHTFLLVITNEKGDNKQTDFTCYFDDVQVNTQVETLKLREFFRQLLQMQKINLQLGSKNKINAYAGRISQIQFRAFDIEDYQSIIANHLLGVQSQSQMLQQTQFKQNFTLPLDHLTSLAHWNPQDNMICRPTQRLIRVERKKNKQEVIICHDMANGYKEDCWAEGCHKKQHSYRFMYFLHTDIFIYFSHRLVTIPPQAYINVCHQFGVKVLGTFITEWEKGEIQNNLFLNGIVENQQTGENEFKGELFYADQLVKICKHHGFDGYLINIEAKILESKMLVQFLQYLRRRLHEEIPGSVLVMYDSVIHSGELKWQSQVNNNNKNFFNSCDYFFTDYHWNFNQLQESVQFAGNEKRKLFTGVDIFGRGSFGGGKGNTYQAVDVVKKSGSSLALFAPGWTYEVLGANSKTEFYLHDQAFWKGQQSIQLFDPKNNEWNVESNGGNGWQKYFNKEMGTEVAISSFEICLRSFTVCINQIVKTSMKQIRGKIFFSCKVKGTGPKFDDPYLITMEILNQQYQVIASMDSFSNTLNKNPVNYQNAQTNKASEEWVTVSLSILLDQLEDHVKGNAYYLKFTQMGKDEEHWAGNYGSQFTGEQINFLIDDPQKDLLKMMSPKRHMELPIQTYFNDAVGSTFYIDGQIYTHYKGFYNILNDFDFMFSYPTKKINQMTVNNQKLQLSTLYDITINEQEAWNGSSCLQLKGLLEANQASIQKYFKTDFKQSGQLTISLNVKNLNKNNMSIFIVLQLDKTFVKYDNTKISVNNGWDSIIYQINNDQTIRGVYLMIQNTSQQRLSYDVLLGGFAIYDNLMQESMKDYLYHQAIKNLVNFKDMSQYIKRIAVKESLKNINCVEKNTMLVDIYLEFQFPPQVQEMIKTVRIFKDKDWLTNSRAMNCFMSDVKFDSDEIQLRFQMVLNNGNHMKVDSTKPIIVLKEQIELIQ